MKILKYPLLFLAYCFHIMPYFVHKSTAWFIGILWFDIIRVRRKDAIANVKRVFPDLSDREARKMARTSLFNIGLTVTEFFSMPFLWRKEFEQMFELEGTEHLDAALAKGKGVFGLSLHLGNGDLGTAALATMGYKSAIISKVFKNKWLNEFWFSSRQAKGVSFIPPRKSSYEILKALKRKELIMFVLDQYTGPPNGILTQFFGRATGTAVGLALFAQRSGAPVIPMYTYRTGPFRHKIVIKEEVVFEEKESKEATLLHMTEKYNRVVETAILEKPEQWMWVHRRWKVGFPGQKETD